jgi:hypothetical protein
MITIEAQKMSKQRLTFKVEGGLKKLSEFYSSKGGEAAATDTYWKNPGALLEALSVAPSKEIRISAGYKHLADTMGDVDFNGWQAEGAPVMQAGKLNDDFIHAFTSVSVAVVVVVITVTVTSGYNREEPAQQRLPVPGGPKFANVAEMSRHAQTVAEQVGWFS